MGAWPGLGGGTRNRKVQNAHQGIAVGVWRDVAASIHPPQRPDYPTMLGLVLGLTVALASPDAPLDAPPPSAPAPHVTAASPPAAAPTPAPSPGDEGEHHQGSDEVPLRWPEEGITVARPAYGMNVSHVKKGGDGSPSYQLTPKQWQQLLHEDPVLARHHHRARFVIPGVTFMIIGGSWLTLSSALAIDGYAAKRATGALFQWALPAGLLAAGTLMTVVGVKARRRLDAERRKLYFSPYASRTSGGAVISARF